MKLINHIANRVLTDKLLPFEVVTHMFPDWESVMDGKLVGQTLFNVNKVPVELKGGVAEYRQRCKDIFSLFETPSNHKPYYCTESMLKCLDLLKIEKQGDHYNWTYFKSLKDGFYTFIFPDNAVLRMRIIASTMEFVHIKYTPVEGLQGNMAWTMFYLDRVTGQLCDHFNHPDVKAIEKFVYSLLCFVYMSETEEVLVAAGSRYGTRKTGKIVNTSPFPMIVITSKWNITSIRTDAIGVRAHFAIRHTGPGRNTPRVVFINAFEKQGYVRRAKSDTL